MSERGESSRRPRRQVGRPRRLREEEEDRPGPSTSRGRQSARTVPPVPPVQPVVPPVDIAAPTGPSVQPEIPGGMPELPPAPPGLISPDMLTWIVRMLHSLGPQAQAPVLAPGQTVAPAPVQTPVPDPHTMELHQVQATGPPSYNGEPDPIKAEEWVQAISQRLETLNIPDVRRPVLASYYLTEAARDWWSAVRRDGLSWDQFEELFQDKFIPESVKVAKAIEFLRLFQVPGMSVAEYTRRFDRLYKYGKMYAPDEKSKAEKYRVGLRSEIGRQIAFLPIVKYDEMVKAALRAEHIIWEAAQQDIQVLEWQSTERGESSSQKKARREETSQSSQRSTESIRQAVQPTPSESKSSQQTEPSRVGGRGRGACFRCGDTGHRVDACTVEGPRCYNCGYYGHVTHQCQFPRGAARRGRGIRREQQLPPVAPPVVPGAPVAPRAEAPTGRGRERVPRADELRQGRAYVLGREESPPPPAHGRGTL